MSTEKMVDAKHQFVLSGEQRFLRLLETIDGVVWEAEQGVGNTFLSPQVERLFGYTVDEWRADPNFWRTHVHPDDFDAALKIDEAAYNATQSYAYEMNYRFFAKSGAVVYVRDLCRVVVEAGQPTRLIGLMIDVTKQKRTELDLLESETRYALAAQGSNDGIWDWDLRTDLLHVSQRFNEIVGLPLTENLQRNGWQFFEQLIDFDDRERTHLAYQRHVRGETASLSVDFRVRRAQGDLLWVNWRGLAHVENGAAVRMAGSLSDLAQRSSSYDALTNLPGRPLFRDRLAHAISMRSEGARFAVLLLDLNGFKAVNDSLGHHEGDALLQRVARRLEANVRQADLVARLGGDEFVVLLESVDLAQATQRANHLAQALSEPYPLDENVVRCSASIGVVASDLPSSSVDDFLRAADNAMYRAKRAGHPTAVFPSDAP
jgi:diguanylate cyclase (GGDEF)-like protein/PAS domain S-box-containing protein